MTEANKLTLPTSSDCFCDVFGFKETTYDKTRERLRVIPGPGNGKDQFIESLVNGKTYCIGTFETPSLGELREQGQGLQLEGCLTVRNEKGDIADFIANPDNRHATFQAASQFNCLEFPGPSTTPERGIAGYIHDKTQGPACSVACLPATAFRNYCAPVLGPSGEDGRKEVIRHGQTKDHQIENLADFGHLVGNRGNRFFKVKAGYTIASKCQLSELNKVLNAMSEKDRDVARAALRVGIHSNVQVTSSNWGRHRVHDPLQCVTQVFASACSVAYNDASSDDDWAAMATLILESAYEATLWAALLTAHRHNGQAASKRVYLTALGGGVFGNRMEWITEAMQRALRRFHNYDLDVRIITYRGDISRGLLALEKEFSSDRGHARFAI